MTPSARRLPQGPNDNNDNDITNTTTSNSNNNVINDRNSILHSIAVLQYM